MDEQFKAPEENTSISAEENTSISAEENTSISAEENTSISAEEMNINNVQETDIDQPTEDSAETPVPAKKKAKNKKLIICIVAVVAAVAVAVTLLIVHKSEFEKVKSECIDIAGFISGSGDYFTLDTDPDDWANMDPNVKALLIGNQQKNTLEAIKYANEALGFNGSLYSKMMETTALMGRQTEETKKYRVSWKYHPDDGLEVTYEKK